MRYQPLPQEDEPMPEEEASPSSSNRDSNDVSPAVLPHTDLTAAGASAAQPQSPDDAPPAYPGLPDEPRVTVHKPNDETALDPPSYNIATELPTYEEVEQQKLREEQGRGGTTHRGFGGPALALFALDGESQGDREEGLLGTDFVFFTAFMVAFLFNWVGFLLLLCFCHTVAGRYGALAGFGLSLAKWTLIVKHSTEIGTQNNDWLWWLIMAFGLLICVRAILQYMNIKREWQQLPRTAQERLLLFY